MPSKNIKLNVILGEKNWKYGFVISGGYLWAVSLLVFCYPQNYFNANLKANKNEEDENRNTIYEYLPKVKKDEEKSYFQEMYECLTSPIFQVANWTRGIIDGFLTAVHYWCADYIRNALGVNDAKLIFLSYTTACITGPVIGGFVGQLVNHFYGSYENPGAPYVCIGLQILVTIFGISATFMSNLYTFVGCLTLFLCFVSSVLSLCIGFLIVSVRPGLKSISNDYSKFTKYIADEMEESIESQGLLDDVKEYISLEEGTTLEDKLIEYEESGNWYFKDDELMIDMPKYSIGYGAMGTISTNINVKDINEYLKDEYKF